MKLAGKTALITGASRGIGAAIAEEFAREGAAVFLTARTPEVIKVAEKLRAMGAKAEALVGDVSEDSHARAIMQQCRTHFGNLNILVNNAGTLIPGKLGMLRQADTEQMFKVNVFAAINLTQYAMRLFPRGAGGSIINFTSIAATRGVTGLAAYSASKAALVGFTKAAAKELAAQNIRVNALAPGFIDTGMTRQFTPEVIQSTTERIRLGRMGRAQEVAACAVFLASDASSYVTGHIMAVDGLLEA